MSCKRFAVTVVLVACQEVTALLMLLVLRKAKQFKLVLVAFIHLVLKCIHMLQLVILECNKQVVHPSIDQDQQSLWVTARIKDFEDIAARPPQVSTGNLRVDILLVNMAVIRFRA